MSRHLMRCLRRISSSNASSSISPFSRLSVASCPNLIDACCERFAPSSALHLFWSCRNISHGSVNVVISQGKLKFETHEVDPPKKEKWTNKKRFKLQKLREKQKRKLANKKDPRRLTVRGKKKKQRFANAEERLKFKIEKAKIKEAMLIERLQNYEVPKLQGPVVKPHEMTGEERFYMKKMAQKGSNYVPVGRRGIFGGVILNMHMHWKKHETVKVICKPCKPGQVHEFAEEIARLSGGVPIHIIGDDTVVFYRGKDYVMPRVMSPIDTLSKKRALEKSKYEQSLDTVRHFIAISEKELELYYRHIALYGDPNNRNPLSNFENEEKHTKELLTFGIPEGGVFHHHIAGTDEDSEVDDLSISELESESEDESDVEDMSSNEPVS